MSPRETQFEFELRDDPEKNKIWGIVYAVASQVCWSFMMPILKILYKHNPSILSSEALYWKSISMVGFCIIYMNITTGTFSLYIPK